MFNFSLRFRALLKILLCLCKGEKFYTFKFYKSIDRVFKKDFYSTTEMRKFGLVLQGPYIIKDNFTLDTIRLYRKNYPEALIVLSTWNVPEQDIATLKEIGIKIIFNQKPEFAGISNVNLQICSTKSGILLVKELGAKYVLKTRTDQRIYNPRFFDYLLNLQLAFPLQDNSKSQKSRLVACSLNTFKLRMYGISDMFLFGDVNDMVRYWDIPFDNRNLNIAQFGSSWRSQAMLQICEVYFCVNYLRALGRNLEFTLQDSLAAIADHFVVIDQKALDLFWNKYSFNEDRFDYGFYDPQLTFNDWLILHTRTVDLDVDESMLDLPLIDED